MITIVCAVDFLDHSFDMKIDGHAFYAEKGQDIVCAAVSVLIETMAERLSDVADINNNDYRVELDDGRITRIQAKGKESGEVLDTILKGLMLTAQTYPENVKVLVTADAAAPV